jgi:cobalt-zinc-cadmium efflux system membrane fusion protein
MTIETRGDHEAAPERSGAGWGRGLRRVLAAILLIAVGAAGATLALRYSERSRAPAVALPAPSSSAPSPAAPAASEPAGDVEVILTPEAVTRAGLKTAQVSASASAASVTVPGSVMANAYREVKVTPIVGGIVTKVHVELGATVRRGMPLVTLVSAELADAQTKYLSMAAMFNADHRKLQRTQELVEIGAASRQELEEITAVHESHATEIEAARQRLLILGLTPEQVGTLTSPSQIVSNIVVPAPIDGVITARSANLGQVVAMGMELLSVTDLSEVWVVGDLYEQDFEAVRVGSTAVITATAYPGMTLRGRVSYIDPRVDPQARTAKARVEVPNADGRLRLGMYVAVTFSGAASSRAVVVPRAAVQAIGDRHVVYIPVKGEEGKFVQRVVRLGAPVGEAYTVLSGIKPGETVVTEGTFFLRAESLKNAPSG